MFLKNLSIIVPCYNYEKLIKKNIFNICNKLNKFKIKYEIIVINDGSKDNTKNKLKELSKIKENIKIINLPENKGKSHCVKVGINASMYNYLVLIDCDLPYFKYFNKVIEKLNQKFDLVIINRKSIKSRLTKQKLNFYQKTRFFIGNAIGLFNKKILDLKFYDTQAGLKGLKKINKFNNINFYSKKFFFDLELIYNYQKLNKKIIDIPIIYKISKNSSIKLFSYKNLYILFELIKVLFLLKIKRLKI